MTGNNGYRILIATSPSILPTNPATTTCSGCAIVDTTTNEFLHPAERSGGGNVLLAGTSD